MAQWPASHLSLLPAAWRPLPHFLFPLTDPENLRLFLITFCFSVLFTCSFLKFCFPKCCCCAQLLQLCPTLCSPMDYSPPGSSVHGILQARILEWVALPRSWGSSQPRGETRIFYDLHLLHWQAGSLPLVPLGEPRPLQW